MSYRLAWTAVTLVLLGLVGCAQAAAVQDPRPTVERFLAARQARNLDATMACFADQPRLSSSIGMSAVGRDAVRAIMAARITDTYVVDNLRVTGERVSWSQHVRRTAMGSPPTTFDEEIEAVVHDGRISSMVTITGGVQPSTATDSAAQLWVGANMLVSLSVLALVAAAVLIGTSASPIHAKWAPTGHLIDGLRDYVARRG